MTGMRASLVADPTAFRAVFADPLELAVLVLFDPGKEGGLSEVFQGLEVLRREGVRLKVLISGDPSVLKRMNLSEEDILRISVLDEASLSVLPAILSTVNAIVVLGEESGRLLERLRDDCPDVPVIYRVGVFSAPESLEGSLTSWDGLSVELLCTRLSRALSLPDKTGASVPKEVSPSPITLERYLLRNEWGIGDELLLSAVAREIVREHPGAQIWIRSRYGFRFPPYVRSDPVPSDARAVEVIYQNPTLYGPESHSPFPGHLVQQMLDKVALDTGMKVKASDVRPELDHPKAVFRSDRTVLLHSKPNPRLSSKDWGIERWEKLTGLLKAAGIRVRQVGGREEPLLDGVEDLRGIEAADLPEIFLQSSAVICVVGFLMHLAEATRTPAIVIYGGREHPAIDGYPDQVHLSSGPLACRGRWGCHLGPDLTCPHAMKCMEQITPELVAREVLGMVAPGELR